MEPEARRYEMFVLLEMDEKKKKKEIYLRIQSEILKFEY